MSNYYVRRTGDDYDYLEHAVMQTAGGGGNGRRSHKYIDKVFKNGKWLYLYARNNINGALSNVKRTFDNVTGLRQRRNYQNIRKQANQYMGRAKVGFQTGMARSVQNAKKAYDKTLFGRIENATSRASKMVNKAGKGFTRGVTKLDKAVKTARGNANKFIDTNITGASARRGMVTNQQRVGNVKGAHDKNMALRNAKKYKSQYNKSLFGRAEQGVDALDAMIRRTKKKAKKTSKNAYIATRPKTMT